jgi:hypothetical protein
MTLENIRKNNSLDKLLGAVKDENQPQEKKSYTDERLWKPELDKSGNGYAVLRFLPAVHGEDLPWAKVYSHAFQGPTGQWYIENSLTSIGGKDPVSEYNSKLWNTGVESALSEFTNQSNFKSYDELKTRLDVVLSGTVSIGNVADEIAESKPTASSAPTTQATDVSSTPDSIEEDDTLSYFEKLANS